MTSIINFDLTFNALDNLNLIGKFGDSMESMELLNADNKFQLATENQLQNITQEITRLQTEYDSNLFQRQRATDYPSLQDQADMQYWDSVNGTTTWLDAINEIKTRYPKP